MSLLLGVNIDHVATLRQARYALNLDAPILEPCVLAAALAAKAGGADSITIHVREDRRHMQDEDAYLIRKEVDLPLNLEMAITPEMTEFACRVLPDFACLVPESREEVTTEGGLHVLSHLEALKITISKLHERGIRISLFIDPDLEQIQAAADLGVEMIELHTGSFALANGATRQEEELKRLREASQFGANLGLQVNAGHGIHPENIKNLFSVKNLTELNIGHTLVSRSIFVGLKEAVIEMKALMSEYPS